MTSISHWMAMISIATASACGHADIATDEQRVVARINGRVISAQQVIHMARQRAHGITPDNARQMVSAALEQVIDEELLMQEALALKLEDEQEVAQSIAAGRRRILAESYLAHIGRNAPEHSAEEIRRFFAANTALFEQRRIYQIHELVAVVPDEKRPQFERMAAKAGSLTHIEHWFRSNGVRFRTTGSTVAAEAVPGEVLEELVQMKETDITVLSFPDLVMVLQLVSARDAPISELEATPVIKHLLSTIRDNERAVTTLRRLREQANIEYSRQRTAPPESDDPSSVPGSVDSEPAIPVTPKGNDTLVRHVRPLTPAHFVER